MHLCIKHWYLLFLCSTGLFIARPASAQQKTYVLTGVITSAGNGRTLENISVQLLPSEALTITNPSGEFSFSALPEGRYQLRVSAVGYATALIPVILPLSSKLVIPLKLRIIGLKEVAVVAKTRIVGSATTIDRSAILHTQPVSLADVLQLVPGQLATNPALGNAQQVNLRQIPTDADAQRVNAFGTQIVLDGVPVSNNANMQNVVSILNGAPTQLPGFSSVAGRGIDLRQIPADNIENIEVIRGIPAARFGDLTSGLILVNSRIGAFAPEVKVRLNPNLTQAAVMGGFSDKLKKNTLNASLDMLWAQDDPRDKFNQYKRLQGQLAWQHYWDEQKRFSTTTILSGYKTLDKLKQDPDDLRYQRVNYSDESALKFSTEGKWQAGKSWISNISYTAALSYAKQTGYLQELVTRDNFTLSGAMKDTTMPGVFAKAEYLNQTTVDGRPMNGYARAEAQLFRNFLSLQHRFSAGAEWRMDVNLGNGRLFDPFQPPRQNYSVGDRPRSLKGIPAIHQLGYYAEDRISGNIGAHRLILQSGIRIDNIAPEGLLRSKYKTIVAPRINLAVEVLKNIWWRGGYGVAAKAVALEHLYPGPRYFDLVSFNYFAVNPAERLVVITTRVINLDDQRMNPYTSRKWETGFDLEKKGFTANISFFMENTSGAIGMNRNIQPLAYAKLQIESTTPGQPPLLSPVPAAIDTFFAAYNQPVNNRRIINKGIEYAIDLPEITAIRTSFNITGAYFHTESYDDGWFVDADKAYTGNTIPSRVGVYYTGYRNISERLNSSVRFIHTIPHLNMVLSALWQTIWIQGTVPGAMSPYPAAYLDRKGRITPIPAEEAKLPAYNDLVRNNGTLLNNYYPPLHLFNIRVTKEWKQGFSFSFYANNFLDNRPLHYDNNVRGSVRRNEPIFFGAEFTVAFGKK